jgi:hypothetical protein
VLIDPRTLREAQFPADCHLIPDWCGVSHATVRLDGEIDSKIGATCDGQLQRYFNVMFGSQLAGKAALTGGSKTLTSVLDTKSGNLLVPKPKTGAIDQWATRALGFKEGRVQFESFTGDIVDCAAAFTSIIHSAILVLYWHGRSEIFGEEFDFARILFAKAATKSLTKEDHETVRDMTAINVALPRDVTEVLSINDLRRIYDPSYVSADGLVDGFPRNCVNHADGHILVTLPYSGSIRATATFRV